MQGMKLARIVREFLKLNHWEMYQKMNKKTVQAYISLERKAKRITLRDLERLEDLYLQGGGTIEEFNAIRKKCAKEEK